MRGYTVLYFDKETLLTTAEILCGLKDNPMELDAIIQKNDNGWKSPKLPIILMMRNERGQIESVGQDINEGGILTIDSFKKGNVSKLLFNGKNFSATIINRIEKLLLPPNDSNIKPNRIFIPTETGKFEINIKFIPNK